MPREAKDCATINNGVGAMPADFTHYNGHESMARQTPWSRKQETNANLRIVILFDDTLSVSFFSTAHIMKPDAKAEFFAENSGHFRNGVYNDDSEYDFILLIVTDDVPVEVSDFSGCTARKALMNGPVHQHRPSGERKRCRLQDSRVGRHAGQSACSRLER